MGIEKFFGTMLATGTTIVSGAVVTQAVEVVTGVNPLTDVASPWLAQTLRGIATSLDSTDVQQAPAEGVGSEQAAPSAGAPAEPSNSARIAAMQTDPNSLIAARVESAAFAGARTTAAVYSEQQQTPARVAAPTTALPAAANPLPEEPTQPALLGTVEPATVHATTGASGAWAPGAGNTWAATGTNNVHATTGASGAAAAAGGGTAASTWGHEDNDGHERAESDHKESRTESREHSEKKKEEHSSSHEGSSDHND